VTQELKADLNSQCRAASDFIRNRIGKMLISRLCTKDIIWTLDRAFWRRQEQQEEKAAVQKHCSTRSFEASTGSCGGAQVQTLVPL
jgi:hypothetical protein